MGRCDEVLAKAYEVDITSVTVTYKACDPVSKLGR